MADDEGYDSDVHDMSYAAYVAQRASPDPTPTRPAKKRKRDMPPEYVKPKGKHGELHPFWRMSFPDEEEEETGRGKVEEGLPGYGVWRRVPGFWRILASDLGYIMTQGDTRVRTPSQNKHTYYWSVGCNGRHEQVHLLVTRAFEGPAQPHHTSANHGGDPELSTNERRSDNRACILDWATYKEQRVDQKKHKPNSTGEPCVVWRVQGGKHGTEHSADYMTPIGPELSYSSSFEAATALGLNTGHLSAVFDGKRKTMAAKDGAQYTGRYAERDDSDLEGEEWKAWSSRLRVSNHGRIQTKHPRGERWGPKRFVSELDGQGYKKICKTLKIHVLVGELFFIGPRPLHWTMWDHIDGDIYNCHITNLHPVTREENGLNTERQRDFYIWKVDAPHKKILCRSQNGAAREYGLDLGRLNAVLRQRVCTGGNGSTYVPKTTNGYGAAWADVVDAEKHSLNELRAKVARLRSLLAARGVEA